MALTDRGPTAGEGADERRPPGGSTAAVLAAPSEAEAIPLFVRQLQEVSGGARE